MSDRITYHQAEDQEKGQQAQAGQIGVTHQINHMSVIQCTSHLQVFTNFYRRRTAIGQTIFFPFHGYAGLRHLRNRAQ